MSSATPSPRSSAPMSISPVDRSSFANGTSPRRSSSTRAVNGAPASLALRRRRQQPPLAGARDEADIDQFGAAEPHALQLEIEVGVAQVDGAGEDRRVEARGAAVRGLPAPALRVDSSAASISGLRTVAVVNGRPPAKRARASMRSRLRPSSQRGLSSCHASGATRSRPRTASGRLTLAPPAASAPGRPSDAACRSKRNARLAPRPGHGRSPPAGAAWPQPGRAPARGAVAGSRSSSGTVPPRTDSRARSPISDAARAAAQRLAAASGQFQRVDARESIGRAPAARA